jgi:ABC-type amino acid transport substrate-binding protein
MRKFAVLGMAIALAAGLSACSSSSKSASDTTTPTTTATALAPECGNTPKPAAAANFKPVKADTLSVVTSLPGPGFWEGSDSDPTKVTSGYEYDIAKCMQSMFGLKNFSVRNVSFDAIVAGTVTNYDIALSQISITP